MRRYGRNHWLRTNKTAKERESGAAMATRLGEFFHLAGTAIAIVIWIAVLIHAADGTGPDHVVVDAIVAILGAMVWLMGRGLRFILAGM